MTRREAYDFFLIAKKALLEMGRPYDASFVDDAMRWLDPSWSIITLEEIRIQSHKLRIFTMSKAKRRDPITTRTWLFVAEVLRNIRV